MTSIRPSAMSLLDRETEIREQIATRARGNRRKARSWRRCSRGSRDCQIGARGLSVASGTVRSMTKSAAGSFVAALLFLLIGLFLLIVMQPAWWSVLTVILAFLATLAMLGRAVFELRRAKS